MIKNKVGAKLMKQTNKENAINKLPGVEGLCVLYLLITKKKKANK